MNDDTMTFEERRRARYMRRSVRRAREEAADRLLGALALALPIALGWMACWAISAAHLAGWM